MKERTKVILHCKDDCDCGNDIKMSLTDDQIRLLNFLYDEDIINGNYWDIQELNKTERWVEV